MSNLIHACYVCRRIMFNHAPVTDVPAFTPETEPENVSHGVCTECEPAEHARMMSEIEAYFATPQTAGANK